MLRARHVWFAQKAAESFGLDEEECKTAVRKNMQRISDFLNGDASCPSHLLAFYQPRELIEALTPQEPSGAPELFFTFGDEEKMRSPKALYFLRVRDKVEADKVGDGALMVGEIGANPIAALRVSLTEMYGKFAAERTEWGKASSEVKEEFKDEIGRVNGALGDALASLDMSLKLGPMAASVDLPELQRQQAVRAGGEVQAKGAKGAARFIDLEVSERMLSVLMEWAGACERFLTKEAYVSEEGAPMVPAELEQRSINSVDHREGPMGILRYWSKRARLLSSVVDNLRRKDVQLTVALLTTVSKQPAEKVPKALVAQLQRWKTMDANVTEACNEAKDNVKYLSTLEKFVEPLGEHGTLQAIMDSLPALINSIKMVHTIARYFNSSKRMTDLLVKVTHAMIAKCAAYILDDPSVEIYGARKGMDLWKYSPATLIPRLTACLKLNELFQETYRLIKERLASNPKSRQFDFNEQAIFGTFDLFCRRVVKVIDLFTTLWQFRTLASHKLEGMGRLMAEFEDLASGLQGRRHDLLVFTTNDFDRDFVEFNVNVEQLEVKLQVFINESFQNIRFAFPEDAAAAAAAGGGGGGEGGALQPPAPGAFKIFSIDGALDLLAQYKAVLVREALVADLDDKVAVIFTAFGRQLDKVQEIYEAEKHNPPRPRNLPPVSGNITWARHLLARIEGLMKRFEGFPAVFASKEGKRVVKVYNRIARTLVAYEYLWINAWVESIETAKAGLQATLLIRHPEDGKLYVNFDAEILQLIREAKCLERLGVAIPESARIVLLQEAKFKAYYAELSQILRDYARVTMRVNPTVSDLMRPALLDLEYALRPGMLTLTWTSMNIGAFTSHVNASLQRLNELVKNVNDAIDARIEKNLRQVARTLLVRLPADKSFTLDEFVALQQEWVLNQASALQIKNLEIESAVGDVCAMLSTYAIDSHISPVSARDCKALVEHFNFFMYSSLLTSAKNTLNALKKRVAGRVSSNLFVMERPFFELSVELQGATVTCSPSLDDVQFSINKSSTAALGCSKQLYDWGQEGIPMEERNSFFTRITDNLDIVRVVLLLTGSMQGTKKATSDFIATFDKFKFLWTEDAEAHSKEFMRKNPNIDDCDRELLWYSELEEQINAVEPLHVIGALSFNTTPIKATLRALKNTWRNIFCDSLHRSAAKQLSDFTDYFKSTLLRLNREPDSLDSIKYLMETLNEVRDKEASIDLALNPVKDLYSLLDACLPEGAITKEEMDMRATLWGNWMKLRDQAEDVTEQIAELQAGFRKKLLEDVKAFKADVSAFRGEFVKHGPMVPGISPADAQDRLRRFEGEFDIRARKRELYVNGEGLFSIPATTYDDLELTEKELVLLSKLYSLYRDVMTRMDDWRTILWPDFTATVQAISQEAEAFSSRCKKMPKRLRDWAAFTSLKDKIEEFQLVLPILQDLSKPSIMPRHWEAVERISGAKLNVNDPEFRLLTLLDAGMVPKQEEIVEVTDAADKELIISGKLDDMDTKWGSARLAFTPWKQRGINVLYQTGLISEELEEAQMNLQTMLTQRNVAFFRERAQGKLKELYETSEALELWMKVQMSWCSLESVFLGGDIAKQMPAVAKKFQKLDKDFAGLMAKAGENSLVVVACANEVLRASLPAMFIELEKCQKELDGYLEQKRNKFPRFYFVSSPVLLQLLSQGSDPLAVQQYYEKIFDSISCVEHDKKDKFIINAMISREGRAEERIQFRKPVKIQGNIEDWLMDVLKEMQRSMKARLEEAVAEVVIASSDLSQLRKFNDAVCAQYALLGIQLMWTTDCETALVGCRRDRSLVAAANKKTLDVLLQLASWCLQDLGSKMNRTKVETLVTIQVHSRDVINDINGMVRAKKVNDANDFEWLKQMRFYWDADASDFLDENGACRVKVTDVPFDYQYEYLGCKERLCITPLTDRCYVTLAQALNMYFGGAPAGPAGTGKTETVKDMGRALGIFVVVTNCTDQMRYTDCAKIFKGLCQGGLWGCFDEFNRIVLPVLSVVAQQVLAITNAKKSAVEYFQFPGDPQNVLLNAVCGFFITMNPGYAGRQELPENLKALFRGVAMMVPDREIIMKVKLCSVGYTNYPSLAKKFFICYQLCEQQLSKQKHYDFGLRNILSVLRTAGATKRLNVTADEEVLLYRTLRDMNLSKFVAQDVPLFLSMLEDLFPKCAKPLKQTYPSYEKAIAKDVAEKKLVAHPSWVTKVVQLHETCLVRHGIMLSGVSGGGKTRIMETLQEALIAVDGRPIKVQRMNPKAIMAYEMYGQTDPATQDWIKGVFSIIWEKSNNRDLPYITWITMDGPVDAIWIEDLNTVLDDNKILTLANGDRFPMTDNVKILFENESLANASPATVSRAGIIFVSETDLDWRPVVESWILLRPVDTQQPLRDLVLQVIGDNTPTDCGHIFDFLNRNTTPVQALTRVGITTNLCNLLHVLSERSAAAIPSPNGDSLPAHKAALERLFAFCTVWTVGSMLEPEDRVKLNDYIKTKVAKDSFPQCEAGETAYDFTLNPATLEWERWQPPVWRYPGGDKLDFSNLLVPSMDSTRALFLIEALHGYTPLKTKAGTPKTGTPVMLLGGPGTAKTSTSLMFFSTFDASVRMLKRINFSSATMPGMFQESIEVELDKRGGKSFGPPNNKKMTVFVDDISMPTVNTWGDQPTNEIVRQIIDMGGVYFLSKDNRGDFKICDDLMYVAAMTHPGGGRNDIPNRLKRQFFSFNLVLPAMKSIDDLYGQMLKGRFPASEFGPDFQAVSSKLTAATIELWRRVKTKMLPTPAKFHYVFNMREMSRTFQGILLTPKETIKTGGIVSPTGEQHVTLLRLWKHECSRVFMDKLTSIGDKKWFESCQEDVIEQSFGSATAAAIKEENFFVDFFREDVYDADEVLVSLAPKIYEPGGTLENVRARVTMFMGKHNEEFPSRKLELVLFEDAMLHLIRISRIIEMPRGSALLVGVGGSGKQSLTRLAAFIARHKLFQITLTKTYGLNTPAGNCLKDDLKGVFALAGHKRQPVTFLFTDSEIKDENFLEYINSVLLTGEVAGLFAKDEMMAMTADLQPAFVKERPGQPDTPDNLKQFFTDCARDNLHMVLCMSPVNAKFPERARKFPGLVSGTTIDWFLSWPEEALVTVSRGYLEPCALEATPAAKEALIMHMGAAHSAVVDVCQEYFVSNRRHVYQTPKSYLSFIAMYITTYTQKLKELNVKEQNINQGLEKLVKGAEDVNAMKKELAAQLVLLQKATDDTNKMLASLQVQQADAEAESAKVAIIKTNCNAEAARIGQEKSSCEADLAKAQPIVDKAIAAVESIKPKDVQDIKGLGAKAPDMILVIFDCVILLFNRPIGPLVVAEINAKKRLLQWFKPSYDQAAPILADSNFLRNLQNFPKETLNEETVELLKPYTEADEYDEAAARNASAAAAGMCVWTKAMGEYYYASKFVKPKLEALAVAMGELAVAQAALAAAEAKEAEVLAIVAGLKATFEAQMGEKTKLENNAAAMQRKLDQASALIGGLAGERVRWGEDSKMFADTKMRLLGDCAIACAFVSYCGPFNQTFRSYMINDKFAADCRKRGVPVSKDLDVISFLVDQGTVGDWNLDGLPTDPLSVQNGILVTRSSRFPMLVDPQGQAITWLRNKERLKVPAPPKTPVLPLSSPKLKDELEFCLSEGKALIVVGVEEELDPLLYPILEKQFILKGKKKLIKLADTEVEVDDKFVMYFITRLPNPHFSPELQAKTTVVDFTVTMKGLEEQLLGRVIAREQNALEKLLNQVLTEANTNTKALLELDAQLLVRLCGNTGNLLDDEELVDVLANTKLKAAEVKEKLAAADETKKSISEKREQFRSVATRGSVLYFSIVEMSLVNCMYQTSLAQFVELFLKSMEVAEKASVAAKRVLNIIDAMTYLVYRYVNKGLYERDKLLFVFCAAVKIFVTAGLFEASEMALFLRGGAALDIANVRKKPSWMANESWLNVIAMSEALPAFKSLPEGITRNDAEWRRWYDHNEPETLPIPDLEASLAENQDTGPWRRLLLIRSLRMDRTLLCVRQFIRASPQLGERYVEPVTDTIEMIYDDMVPHVPVIFLLSTGADPTDSIEQLCKKKKQSIVCVSLGEGQEPVAIKAINAAAVNGSWVLLQNCELGLDLMDKMEDIMIKLKETQHADMRLFITALPSPEFPLGLLQMSTKITNEPPAGMRAGLLRSYTVMVDQDRLDRIDNPVWRQLVFAMCFQHSAVQERRKFGPLGWSIAYEYNNGDLSACLLYLEKHIYSGAISWPTVQYIISDCQYGGKITDNMDRRCFSTYTAAWIAARVLAPGFKYNPENAVGKIPGNFQYTIPDMPDLEGFRRHISSFPEIDSPEVYGLHPNADLTFRVKEVTALLNTLGETQPKSSGGGSGKSMDEVVKEKAAELLLLVPADYIEEEFVVKIRRLEGGADDPLNIFLFQELQRLQSVIKRVRTMLVAMISAINGEIVMTSELLVAMTDVFDAKVPRPWLYTPGGDEFSWLMPYLGTWFASFKERDAALGGWLNLGRPNSFWMTGFSNPQGFLTSMKQVVTRIHRKDMWALDDVDYQCEVQLETEGSQIKTAIKEGVYIHGLFIDGARWDKAGQTLAESEPKKLFAPMPVIFVTVMTKEVMAKRRFDLFGAGYDAKLYDAPCYRYPLRNDRYRVFQVTIPSLNHNTDHWILRGAALLLLTA